uniref:HTH psq-type domain-containing protein n=1 Tax=Rhodnius prolixus TaxID=13249 RepID=T1HKH1_RHOPR
MVDAIKTVREKKLGIREAALHFRIPKSKLHRLLSKQTDSEDDSDVSVSSGESDLSTPPQNSTPDNEDCGLHFLRRKVQELKVHCLLSLSSYGMHYVREGVIRL